MTEPRDPPALLDAVSDEVARAWLERSRAAQGLPMIVDDFDVVVAVVRLICGEDLADDGSVT